jgi:hypothetical protein
MREVLRHAAEQWIADRADRAGRSRRDPASETRVAE